MMGSHIHSSQPQAIMYGIFELMALASLNLSCANVLCADLEGRGPFGICLIVQLFLGIHHRTWGFLTSIFGGIVLEIVGYIARIQMHYNPFRKGPFLMQVPLSFLSLLSHSKR